MSYVLRVTCNNKPITRNTLPRNIPTCSSNSSLALKLTKFHTSAGWCFQCRFCGSSQREYAYSATELISTLKDIHHLNRRRNPYQFLCCDLKPSTEPGSFYRPLLFQPLQAIYCVWQAHKQAKVPYRNLHRLLHFY